VGASRNLGFALLLLVVNVIGESRKRRRKHGKRRERRAKQHCSFHVVYPLKKNRTRDHASTPLVVIAPPGIAVQETAQDFSGARPPPGIEGTIREQKRQGSAARDA
jgi:hypothetical protein